jgi:hypothetical protein
VDTGERQKSTPIVPFSTDFQGSRRASWRALKTYDAIRIFKKINKENDKEDINCLIA